jgi:lincosamide nucleotidyltransferase A/C/D/E
MELDAVKRLVDRLDDASVRYWVAGGWGVDALVGHQTRPHRDLDLAIDAHDWEVSLGVVAELGYVRETDWLPVRVELRGPEGWVDLHPVRFDESGDGVQAGLDGATFAYPMKDLVTGSLGERAVPCVSVAWQVRAHSGYDPRPEDVHDLDVLARLPR